MTIYRLTKRVLIYLGNLHNYKSNQEKKMKQIGIQSRPENEILFRNEYVDTQISRLILRVSRLMVSISRLILLISRLFYTTL